MAWFALPFRHSYATVTYPNVFSTLVASSPTPEVRIGAVVAVVARTVAAHQNLQPSDIVAWRSFLFAPVVGGLLSKRPKAVTLS